MSIDGLPPLRDVISRYGLRAKKSYGQHFLLNLDMTTKIVRSAGDLVGSTILEVGPGPGGLTRALLASGVERVVAIERDSRCIPALSEIASYYSGRLEVIEGDALEIDHSELVRGAGSVHIVSNLPYNIATLLYVNWLTSPTWPPFWDSMTLMFQREVASRIVSNVGDKSWGRLGILTSFRCTSKKNFDVDGRCFVPPPRVTSSVIGVRPRPEPADVNLLDLERVTSLAFGQRRKMLRQSLKQLGGEEFLSRAGIDATRRAEQLTLDEFMSLARLLGSAR